MLLYSHWRQRLSKQKSYNIENNKDKDKPEEKGRISLELAIQKQNILDHKQNAKK